MTKLLLAAILFGTTSLILSTAALATEGEAKGGQQMEETTQQQGTQPGAPQENVNQGER